MATKSGRNIDKLVTRTEKLASRAGLIQRITDETPKLGSDSAYETPGTLNELARRRDLVHTHKVLAEFLKARRAAYAKLRREIRPALNRDMAVLEKELDEGSGG